MAEFENDGGSRKLTTPSVLDAHSAVSNTIPANYTGYVAGTYEVASGKTLEILPGATLEVG